MIMQSVGLCDVVTVERNDSGRITVSTRWGTGDRAGCFRRLSPRQPAGGAAVLPPDDDRNIACRAAAAFYAHAGISDTGTAITIEKHIPMEAGMAGGSADGAAVIRALNVLCGTDYDDPTLWDIGVTVGADIPFCITGGTMLSEGKGEILHPLPGLAAFAAPPVVLLCKPDVGVSTGRAYAAVDGCPAGRIVRPDTRAMRTALAAGDTRAAAAALGNVFEEVLRVGACESIRTAMLAQGALGACMTGSGTTVFGLFDREETAVRCGTALGKDFACVYLTHAERAGCYVL